MSEWIDVNVKWPEREYGKKILAYGGYGDHRYVFECECDEDGDWCNLGGDAFTHWMPHPGDPK